MSLQNDLTQGNVSKQILRFALPLILSNLFQALYNAVDMYFVGQYVGTAGLSAVSTSGPVMNIVLMAVAGLSVGLSVQLGSCVGRHDQAKIRKVADTAILVYLGISVVITVAGIWAAPGILRLISTPAEAFDFAVEYLRIIFGGMVFTLGYNLICALQRGFGDSRSSMIFVIIATFTNVGLDYWFIRKLNWGPSGAALATVISQAFSFGMGVAYFRIQEHVVTFVPWRWRFARQSCRDLARLGLPMALQQVSVTVSHLTLSGIVNSSGLTASAAYGIGVKLDGFAILPCNAFGDAVAAITSQNISCGKEDRALAAVRTAQRTALLVNILMTAGIFLLAPYLAAIFDSSAAVIGSTASYLRVSCFMYLIFAYLHPLIGFVKGTGNSMFTLGNSVVSQYVVRIPVAFLLAKLCNLGLTGIALAWISAPVYSTIHYLRYMKQKRWQTFLKKDRSEEE